MFWRKQEHISNEEFIANANSGDILLFRGKKLGARLARSVTNSNYDHVAMVLKFDMENSIYLLDATVAGVNITSWPQFLLFKDDVYSQTVWRKLQVKRDDEFIRKLQGFIKNVHKKKYKLSISKLMKK